MTPVPPAKHGVKCRYCDLDARLYVIDTDGFKSPVCADHYGKRTWLVDHPEINSRNTTDNLAEGAIVGFDGYLKKA